VAFLKVFFLTKFANLISKLFIEKNLISKLINIYNYRVNKIKKPKML
jgi:hypothetical protein